jgi:hypothetical protein
MLRIFTTLALFLIGQPFLAQQLTYEKHEDGILVMEDGRKVLFYQASTKSHEENSRGPTMCTRSTMSMECPSLKTFRQIIYTTGGFLGLAPGVNRRGAGWRSMGMPGF